MHSSPTTLQTTPSPFIPPHLTHHTPPFSLLPSPSNPAAATQDAQEREAQAAKRREEAAWRERMFAEAHEDDPFAAGDYMEQWEREGGDYQRDSDSEDAYARKVRGAPCALRGRCYAARVPRCTAGVFASDRLGASSIPKGPEIYAERRVTHHRWCPPPPALCAQRESTSGANRRRRMRSGGASARGLLRGLGETHPRWGVNDYTESLGPFPPPSCISGVHFRTFAIVVKFSP